MTTPTPQAPTVLQAWRHTPCASAAAPQTTVVVPDGCRDLIGRLTPQGVQWFVTPLANTTYTVCSQPGEAFVGYRLRPGTQLDEAALLRQVAGRCLSTDVQPWLAGLTHGDPRVAQALQALAGCASVPAAARSLGVSTRSLERLLCHATGRAPAYWRQLARARRAAQALAVPLPLAAARLTHPTPQPMPLAELAADHGYADQAHLSRDMRRWFAATPRQLRSDAALRQAMGLSGYG